MANSPLGLLSGLRLRRLLLRLLPLDCRLLGLGRRLGRRLRYPRRGVRLAARLALRAACALRGGLGRGIVLAAARPHARVGRVANLALFCSRRVDKGTLRAGPLLRALPLIVLHCSPIGGVRRRGGDLALARLALLLLAQARSRALAVGAVVQDGWRLRRGTAGACAPFAVGRGGLDGLLGGRGGAERLEFELRQVHRCVILVEPVGEDCHHQCLKVVVATKRTSRRDWEAARGALFLADTNGGLDALAAEAVEALRRRRLPQQAEAHCA